MPSNRARDRARRLAAPSRRIKKLERRLTPSRRERLDRIAGAFEAEGLDVAKIYSADAWHRLKAAEGDPGTTPLGRALHRLALAGWSVEQVAAIFNRSPDLIDRILRAHMADLSRQASDPIHRYRRELAAGRCSLTAPEIAALETFAAAFAKYQAAIGNGGLIVTPGTGGQPMTEKALRAIESEYRRLCGLVKHDAGPRALSACQSVALGVYVSDFDSLRLAAFAITGGAIPHPFCASLNAAGY